ncbi:hypothetical protein [Ferrimicrobium sp.]|uniref:hypothetical protein n=1 Tax=Ferrimicrobium sp. TaxID=2926050 RepID=UPI002621D14C|nr:hypothetical protein [Ferrimicrobium sp.]
MTTLEPPVPLAKLLGAIEAAKTDELATPTVSAVRVLDTDLRKFTPAKSSASLRAVVESVGTYFLELDDSSGEVLLHTTTPQVVSKVNRSLEDLVGGVKVSEWPEER